MRSVRTCAPVAAALTLLACADGSGAPTDGGPDAGFEPAIGAVGTMAASTTKFWEDGSSVGWNEVTQQLILEFRSNPADAARNFSYVSAAQHGAVQAATSEKEGRDHPSTRAAAAAASATVLKYLYPAASARLDAMLAAQLADDPWPGERHRDAGAGAAIGRRIGAEYVARAQTDGFADATQVPPPVGPQYWFRILTPFNPPPYKPLLGSRSKPWFLTSGSQFRALPHPGFNSPAFLAALAEVRDIAANRTPEQDSIARLWDHTVPASPAGPIMPMGHWNARARDLIVRHRLNEARAARALVLVNMAGWDAFIGCWDSKYAYWLARPHMVDPSIRWVSWLSIVPPHPSYPSGHSCMTGAATAILADLFPSERSALATEADEASISRVYGGIHFRFDGEAGLRLGRDVAAWTLSQFGTAPSSVATAQ
jgi:membrane-associated phospholipid phosphatase